jgi:hypothetical protein
MNDAQKARLAQGRSEYFRKKKEERDMKLDKDEAIPPQRAERTERITEEIKADVPPMAQPTTLGVKLSIDEMRLDHAAHVCVIEQAKESVKAMGLPEHLAVAMLQSLCAGHIQRMNDLAEVLKRY